TTMSTRLLAAGAVPVGQTASPEVGRLFYTTSVLHGATHNPWDLTKAPGGSSGGSGAALSAGLVPLATGPGLGGADRVPARWGRRRRREGHIRARAPQPRLSGPRQHGPLRAARAIGARLCAVPRRRRRCRPARSVLVARARGPLRAAARATTAVGLAGRRRR